ncbi:hypothetical protein XA68_12029 [Ophiocordyceps unilateralis]|uniref:Uncharacterized protein n=1 Tax=Ophiocordyceps unilateralis TaxID=268505 RepID=A0A2A9PFL9_OPHUN|nr:hypothetical protein XA68_12029 [Ophiocordyceps unilateralis]
MASFFFVDLWNAIFTPGPTPTLLRATNITFACLQLVLGALLFTTASIHFVILSGLCASLWWSINWFVTELNAQQQQQQPQKQPQQQQQQKKRRRQDVEESSDTEVEPPPPLTDTAATKVESSGLAADLRLRSAAAARAHHQPPPLDGTQSSVSTEDEWEKVSGSERSKES